MWPYFIFTPGAKEKYLGFKYRKSFVGLLIRLDEYLKEVLKPKIFAQRFAIAILTSITFCLVMGVLSRAFEPLFVLAGSAVFTVTYRYLLHDLASLKFEDGVESLQGELPLETLSEPAHSAQNHQKDNDSNS